MRSLIEFERFWCLKTHSWQRIVNNLAIYTCIRLFDIWHLKVNKADWLNLSWKRQSLLQLNLPHLRDIYSIWHDTCMKLFKFLQLHLYKVWLSHFTHLSFYWNKVPAAAPWIPSLVTHGEKNIVCICSLHTINIRLTYVPVIANSDFTCGTY